MEKYGLCSLTFDDSHSKNVFQITGYFYQVLFCLGLLDAISKEYNVSKVHLLK